MYNHYKKQSFPRKKKQPENTTKLLLTFQLDALALLRVRMTWTQENIKIYRLHRC